MWAIKKDYKKTPFESFDDAYNEMVNNHKNSDLSLIETKPSGIEVAHFLSVSDTGTVISTYSSSVINSPGDL